MTTNDHGTVIIVRRLLAAAAVLLAVAASGAVGALLAGPAAAAARPCVGVIVDTGPLGGSVRTGCALGDPATGLAALTKAGFGYTPRPRDGLICQVDAQPASCATTTASTYWSYWYREPGSRTWVYANQGAGTHDPKPGSTEAWVWQDGGRRPPPAIAQDTICPQGAQPAPTKTAAPKPKPSASATRRPATTRPSATPTSARPSGARARPTRHRSGTPAPSAETTAPAAPSSSAPVVAPSSPTGPSSPEDRAPTAPVNAETNPGDGPALPTAAGAALGGVLVVGLGVAAVLRSRRGAP